MKYIPLISIIILSVISVLLMLEIVGLWHTLVDMQERQNQTVDILGRTIQIIEQLHPE